MDYGAIISDSIDYSREALAGKINIWLVFIICSLPFALIQFTFDPENLRAAKVTDWQDILSLIPWPQIIALFLAGLLLSFIISGYIVRVYRGTTPPPEFDTWGSLYLDGIKVMIVETVWLLPSFIVLGIAFVLMFVAMNNGTGAESMGLMLAATLLLFVAFGLILLGSLFGIVGRIHFARTGSIREGIRYSAINSMIQTIGFGHYILALIMLWIVGFIFSVIIGILSAIPFLGWLIALVFNPFLMVFNARYLSRLYDSAAPEVPAPVSTP